MVTEGRVFVNGQKAISPAQLVSADDAIEVRPEREYVGRGAYKLDAALEAFGVQVSGKVCADVGASIGGFTEVLLKRGAKKVYAIDVGRGKLDVKLRDDPRVVVMEGVNALSLPLLPEAVGIIAVDVSFTSLARLLPNIRPWLSEEGSVVALFKPQYEADASLLRHGIVEDEKVRQNLLSSFRDWLREEGWRERSMIVSPIRGAEGNVEYLFFLEVER